MMVRAGALELVAGKEVRRILRPPIEKALLPGGFTRTGTTPPVEFPRPKGWCLKVADNRFAVVWLQLGKYGFSREWGGIFTLNFELSSRPVAVDDMLLQQRWWQLLDGSDRKQARQIERRVLAALPEPPSPRPLLQKWLMTGHFPWEDIWARYATVEDVHTWATFLNETLPSTASRFLTRARAKAR